MSVYIFDDVLPAGDAKKVENLVKEEAIVLLVELLPEGQTTIRLSYRRD